MNIVMPILALVAFPALVNAAQPNVKYTPEQIEVCSPTLKVVSDSDSDRSHVGERATATATSRLSASKGKMLDWRPGSYVSTVGGLHVNKPGKPTVTKRANGTMVTQVVYISQAHRGRSLRFGRNVSVHNSLAVYEVNATAKCADTLGFFKF